MLVESFRSRRSALVASLLPALGLLGCGESRSARPSEGRLGEACGEPRPVTANEVDVDGDAPECGGGACVHGADVALGAATSQGMCSCRCDGPASAGPFCSCATGFVCREEIRSLGLSDASAVGSYCVPE